MTSRFFGSLLLVVLLTTTASAATPAQDARAVVQSFYRWYVSRPSNFDPGLQRYLTASAYALYARCFSKNPSPRTIVIDDDPFSGTQVGTYAAGAGTATVKGTQATVPVVLTVGLHPTDNLKRNATVVVQKVGSAWEIANIITFAKDEPTTNFVADATKALARIK